MLGTPPSSVARWPSVQMAWLPGPPLPPGLERTKGCSRRSATVDKVAPAVNRMVDKAHDTIDRVAQSAGPAADTVQSAVREATDKSARFADACASSIRDQPIKAVVSALAVGYVIGRLMR